MTRRSLFAAIAGLFGFKAAPTAAVTPFQIHKSEVIAATWILDQESLAPLCYGVDFAGAGNPSFTVECVAELQNGEWVPVEFSRS